MKMKRRFLLQIFCLLFFVQVSRAAIAHDADSNSGEVTTQTFTWTHTCTGSNLVLIVGVLIDSGATDTVSTLTYNGVALTFIRRDRLTVDGLTVELWYLAGPATGANTVSVTLSNAPSFSALAGAVSLTGVDQAAALDANNGATGAAGTQPSVTVTTVADNAWIVDAVMDNINEAITAGQTQAWQVAGPIANGRYAGEYFGPQTPAGAKAMTWTGLTRSWATSAASFKPASAAAAPAGVNKRQKIEQMDDPMTNMGAAPSDVNKSRKLERLEGK